MSSGPDLTAVTAPRPVPVLMTCGAIEENLANNKLMASALRRQGHAVTMRIVPDAHTMIGWRDAWSPELDDLIGALR
jgi:enterochelin esterase family protein